ncbi:MAG: hypothetical protein AMXMBFR58_08210 [Phycisphaerae bacterium]
MFQNSVTCPVIGLSALLLTSAVVRAQVECEIPEPDCSGIPYLQPGQTWTINPDWTPNRLPGVVFMLTNGSFCTDVNESNYRGLNEYWCDPADDPNCQLEPGGISGVQKLEGFLNDAWSAGFRRFVLYAPAGTVWSGKLPDGPDADTFSDSAGQ